MYKNEQVVQKILLMDSVAVNGVCAPCPVWADGDAAETLGTDLQTSELLRFGRPWPVVQSCQNSRVGVMSGSRPISWGHFLFCFFIHAGLLHAVGAGGKLGSDAFSRMRGRA